MWTGEKCREGLEYIITTPSLLDVDSSADESLKVEVEFARMSIGELTPD
jgi:hypothetical protein